MNKLLIRVFIFLVLVVLIENLLISKYFKKFNTFEYSINEFYEESKDSNFDIIFIGSSHARNTYNTKIIDSIFKVKSYNLGSGGQRLFVSNYLLKDIIKKNKPKLVVLDIFPGSLDFPTSTIPKSNQLTVFDYSKFSINKLKAIYEIYSIHEFPSVFSKVIRNHDKWNDITFKQPVFNPDSKEIEYSNGFIGTYRNLNNKDLQKYSNYKDKIKNLVETEGIKLSDTLFKNEFEEIMKTISICKESNINLIISSAPYFVSLYSPNHTKFHKLLKFKSEENGWDYIDFNQKFEELDLKLSDFMDGSHLNIYGANKVTIDLALYLKTKNYFKNFDNQYINELTTIRDSTNNGFQEIKEQGVTPELIFNQLEHEFNSKISIDQMALSSNNENRYIAFRVTENFSKEILNKYDFGIHLLFNKEDFDKRPNWMLGTDKDRETASISPEIVEINNEKFIFLKMGPSELSNYKKLRIFLKDKGKFKGVIGKTLEIDNATFKN